MVLDYQTGKIYKVTSSAGNPYIGSTCLPLAVRKSLHKSLGDRYSVKIHIHQPDFEIQLVEEYPCFSRTELTQRERYWIETIPCCNQRRAYRTLEEVQNYAKEYYNNDKWREYHKQYRRTKLMRELPFHGK